MTKEDIPRGSLDLNRSVQAQNKFNLDFCEPIRNVTFWLGKHFVFCTHSNHTCDNHTAFQKHRETTEAILCALDLYDTLSKFMYKGCILSGEFYTVLHFYVNVKDTQFYCTKYVLQKSRT